MSNLVAKRYVKALTKSRNLEHIDVINQQLKLISTAYLNEKFQNIIGSVDVTTYNKVDLVLSFLGDRNDYLVNNLIILLGKNRRLGIIPAISKELEKEYAILINSYVGIVYSNENLSNEFLNELETNFENKFNIKLQLTNQICEYDGIKVDIDGLGVEIGFAKNKFKSQMIEHILKAV